MNDKNLKIKSKLFKGIEDNDPKLQLNQTLIITGVNVTDLNEGKLFEEESLNLNGTIIENREDEIKVPSNNIIVLNPGTNNIHKNIKNNSPLDLTNSKNTTVIYMEDLNQSNS